VPLNLLLYIFSRLFKDLSSLDPGALPNLFERAEDNSKFGKRRIAAAGRILE
jgi:hypothetical protein